MSIYPSNNVIDLKKKVPAKNFGNTTDLWGIEKRQIKLAYKRGKSTRWIANHVGISEQSVKDYIDYLIDNSKCQIG